MLSKADKTKQFIIEKAAHLFNSKGFYGTSMEDIIQATGLAKGGIYGNFKSKEEIAIQAFEYAYQTVVNELAVRVRARTNAVDKLHAILDYYRNYSEESPIKGGCPVLNTSCDADDTLPAVRARVVQAVDQMLNTLKLIIESGQRKGEIRPDIRAAETADMLYSQIEGGIMLAKVYGSSQKLNRLLDNLKGYIDRELKA